MNTFWSPKTSFSDPDYVPTVYTFETTAELLALDSVQRCNKPGAKFAISGGHLMVITRDGFEWWVVGRIGQPERVDLPEWDGVKIRVQLNDGTKTVVSKEVLSICGNEITLRDGSIATRIEGI